MKIFLLCVWLGCSGGHEVDLEVFVELRDCAVGTRKAAYPVLEQVLLDMVNREHRYSQVVRLTAFDCVLATRDRRTLPLLRRIARIEYVENESVETTLDLIAIRGALGALVELGSEDAAELNLRHLAGDDWVQTEALRNLEKLEFWDATPAVEELFCSLPRDGESFLVVVRAAEYLDSSPRSTASLCRCIADVRRGYGERLEARELPFERILSDRLDLLTARLGCD